MHRTNLYLTEDQERALDRQARRAGISRSALVRLLIDRGLAAAPSVSPETEQELMSLARSYDETVAELFDDDRELRIDR